MARLKKLEPSEIDGSIKPLYDDFIQERGAVPNMFRILAQVPEIMKTVFDHFRAVMPDRNVTTRVKELVAVRVSHINQSKY